MGCTIYIHIYMKVDVLQWRHNARDGVQNHQPHDCLLNRLFRHRWKKKSKLRVTGLCDRCHWLRWPVNSPHKVPVTRKKFPFEDVIMVLCHRIMSFLQLYIMMKFNDESFQMTALCAEIRRVVCQLWKALICISSHWKVRVVMMPTYNERPVGRIHPNAYDLSRIWYYNDKQIFIS